MTEIIRRLFQLLAFFSQSDIGPLIGRIDVVAVRLVELQALSFFLSLTHTHKHTSKHKTQEQQANRMQTKHHYSKP